MSYKTSIALGTFDGFHKGHMAVIDKAKQSKYPFAVLYFDEHPLKALTGKAPAELMSDNVLFRIRYENELDFYHIDFAEICDQTPEEFFHKILIGELQAGELTCGENYTFGKGGVGKAEDLKRLCEENDIICNIVNTIYYKDEPISSTRIRKAIEEGNIEDANAMLGREFSYSFPVISGNKIGRTIGFPTANQKIPDNFVHLKHGVYASAVEIEHKLYPAVTNFGVRPTVDGDNLFSETYIHGFSGDLYNKYLEVRILKFLRPEQKFENIQQLSAVISKDCEKSLEIFNNTLEKSK